MANEIQLKRSSVSGRIPDAANVLVGEPVVNLADQVIYTKDGSGTVKVIGSGVLGGLSDVSNSSPLPNQVLTWNSTNNQWEPADVTTESVAASGFTVDKFSGDGTTVNFQLSRTPFNVDSLIVTIQGVKQRSSNDFVLVGNVITFTEAPPNTDIIDIIHLASGAAGVSSINGFEGNVTLTTANITENTNLYFTQQRARDSISVSGAGSYDNLTGVINITGGVTSVGGATGAVSNVQIASGVVSSGLLTTANVSELNNLYFTNARVYSNVIELNYITQSSLEGYATNSQLESYETKSNVELKANISDLTTANIAEVNNLYFTNARVADHLLEVGNIIPRGNNIQSLGTNENRFKDLFLAGNTIYLGNIIITETFTTFSVLDDQGNTVFTATPSEGFINSTVYTLPTDHGELDGFESTDAFGVPLTTVYDCMEPSGKIAYYDYEQ